MTSTLLTNTDSNDLIMENIKVEEAQLIVSAMTELHRNCLIDTFKKPFDMEILPNCNEQASLSTNGKKFVNLVEFYKNRQSNKGIKDEKFEIGNCIGEKINVYIDEEIILEVSEYSMNLNKCNICLQKINTSISTHLNDHKFDKKSCVLCNQEFNYEIQLNMHKCELVDFNEPLIRNLSNDVFYSCKLCCSNNKDDDSEHFPTYDIYCSHVKSFHQSTVNCMFCENKFNSANLYIHHLKFDHLFSNLNCICEACCRENVKIEAI